MLVLAQADTDPHPPPYTATASQANNHHRPASSSYAGLIQAVSHRQQLLECLLEIGYKLCSSKVQQ